MFVSAGRQHCVAVDRSGRMYMWGNQQHGKLGNGEKEGKCTTPFLVTFETGPKGSGIPPQELNVLYAALGNKYSWFIRSKDMNTHWL